MISKSIFRLSEEKFLKKLPELLEHNGYTQDSITATKHYVYVKGDMPVMLVAHLDTVFKKLPSIILHDKDQNIMTSPQGLGADDRAGVYALLELSREFKPYLLFTTEEEVGQIGAEIASKEISPPDVNLIIEFDRKNKDDAVFYDCLNSKFIDYIIQFGFKESFGTVSDISHICPAWDIAGVNLSCGYYNPHTKEEYLKVNELEANINKVKKIFLNLPKERFRYYTNEYFKFYDTVFDKYGIKFFNKYNTKECCICGDTNEKSLIKHEGDYYCPDCFFASYFYCENCQEYLDISEMSPDHDYCMDCYKQLTYEIIDSKKSN